MNKKFNIALVGNAPVEKHGILNAMLDDETLQEMCDIQLYGADDMAIKDALHDAIDDYLDGVISGIVCLPTNEPLELTIKDIMGEEAKDVMPLYIHSTSRMASATSSVSISAEELTSAVKTLNRALKRDLSILNPRIAVTSVGDEISATEGSADITVIAPTVSELVKGGIQVFGPIAAKKIFDNDDFMAFDAVMTMRKGQCHEEFCKATNEETVTLFAGIEIPLVQAQAEGMVQAISIANDTARNRKVYDIPFANPLQKLYHERKEDGDKARFAVKKKGFNPAEHRRENVNYIKANPTPNTEGIKEYKTE